MRVLVACEYSGRVRDAFRRWGHDAISCDFLDTESPGPHYKGNVLDLINWQQGKRFDFEDGFGRTPAWFAHGPKGNALGFDLMICHPECTYLSVSGMHWTTRGLRDPQLTEDALNFVKLLMNAPIEKICLENPISVISSRIRKPDQIIQPWWFGDDASKSTCLWLKNLKPLTHTHIIEPRFICCGVEVPNNDKYGCPHCCGEKKPKPRWGNQCDSGQNKLGPNKDRWKERSRTYQGVADAMASQWGGFI